MSQIIRLLIADDHPVARDGLRGIFEASGEFEAGGAGRPTAGRRSTGPRPCTLDVILMDLRMPVLDGVSVIKLLAEKGIGARVLGADHLRHRHRRGARDRGPPDPATC